MATRLGSLEGESRKSASLLDLLLQRSQQECKRATILACKPKVQFPLLIHHQLRNMVNYVDTRIRREGGKWVQWPSELEADTNPSQIT